MSNLKLDLDWSHANDPDPRRANTAAELLIRIGDVPATQLFDSWSQTVIDRTRLSVYPLAEWFAVNWWRLHAEAPFEGSLPPIEWRLAHDLGAVGGGFVWPRIRFTSDGSIIQVSALARKNAPWEPVRYLNNIPATPINVTDFDREVSAFVALVIQRLSTLSIDAEPLVTIWNDVLAERADPEVAEWRTWEARLGYGADEAPDDIMRAVEQFASQIGSQAMAELAPLLRPAEAETLKRFDELARSSGVEARLDLSSLRSEPSEGLPPWKIGRQLSYEVRTLCRLDTGPLDDIDLADLLGVSKDIFNAERSSAANIGLGVRMLEQNSTILHFRKQNRPGRRFEAARFIADHLISSDDDVWLPLTDRATARQKIQRAFAAELLAPIEQLQDFLGDSRQSEKIEDAGDYFGLSSLAIRTQLVNHGLLEDMSV